MTCAVQFALLSVDDGYQTNDLPREMMNDMGSRLCRAIFDGIVEDGRDGRYPVRPSGDPRF